MTTGMGLGDEVAGIWRDVMAAPAADTDESFFAAGGTSLRAVQLVRRIEDAYGVSIPLAEIYDDGSIDRLTEIVEQSLLDDLHELSEGTAEPAAPGLGRD
jgi:acyl carrier protein